MSNELGLTNNGGPVNSSCRNEVKRLLKLAGPLILVNVSIFSLQVISVMFVGHLGDELQLAGASLAFAFAFVTGISLLMGLAGALETYCGQSYGAGKYELLGIYMQRAMFVLLVICIPLACIWASTEPILLLCKQDREISREAGKYAQFMIPSIFAIALLQCQIRFLQAQKIVVPMLFTCGFTTLLHVLICWVLVFKSGLESKGAALANGVSNWINVLVLALYIRLSASCRLTWTGFSNEAFHDIWKFLKLAIPSAAMNCLESWSFEVMVLLAGILPNPQLETSVLSISLNTSGMIFMILLGLGSATSTRVSNELGAGKPKEARFALYISLAMVLIEGILVSTSIIVGRKFWSSLFSKEEKVVNKVAESLIFVAGAHIGNGIQFILSGAVRGCGRQKIGAFINLGAYYLFGVPTGIVLAFVYHIGTKGFLIGIIVAVTAQALFYTILTIRTDWGKEAKKAADRVNDSSVASAA